MCIWDLNPGDSIVSRRLARLWPCKLFRRSKDVSPGVTLDGAGVRAVVTRRPGMGQGGRWGSGGGGRARRQSRKRQWRGERRPAGPDASMHSPIKDQCKADGHETKSARARGRAWRGLGRLAASGIYCRSTSAGIYGRDRSRWSEWTRSMYASSEWGSPGAEPTANETGRDGSGRARRIAGASATIEHVEVHGT